MKRPLLRLLGGLLLAASFAFSSHAATVPVEVTMLHGSAASQVGGASGREVSRREVMYLVLDYSYSMTINRDGGKETRWKKLVDSLRETVKSVKPGTEVRIAWIGGNREKEDPVIVRTDLDRAALRSLVEKRGSPPSGNKTPLFATLRRVCGEAKELVGQGCTVVVNVFSDGESSEVPLYRGRESWTKEQIAELDDNFAGLFSDARFKTCLVWINPSETPGDDRLLGDKWRIGYREAPSLYFVSVQPTPVRVELSANAQPGSLAYGFFVPDEVWNKMKGKWAKFQLLKDGKPAGTPKPIQIKDSQTCSLDVPDALLKGESAGGLSIALADLPQPEGTVIDDPAAVDLVVSAPKRLTVSSVRPADGTVLKEGDEVRFSVVATAGATCEWSFGDGQTGTGPEAAHKYANAGTYTAKVLVRKDGFEPADGISREVKGVEVVRAAVVLGPFDSPAVGKKAVFRCKGEGPVSGYTWFVDGSPFAGKDSDKKDSSELEWVFQETGNHIVQVRADLGRGLGSVRSEEKTVSVGVAPFIRIEAPVSGSSSVVGEPVRLSLKAEGGVADVEWRISGPDAKTVPSPAAMGAEWVPEKPGDYTIRAVDKAGKAEPSGEVVVKVRPKDVKLAISADISDGMTVPTGKDFLLKAETKGVGSVRWSVVDDEKGTTNALGSVKPDLSGNAAKTWNPDPKEGDGARWIVAEDEAGAAEPVSVLVNLKTEAELSIEKPSDYHPVAFGTPVELAAKADGAVENIRWFVDGKEIKGKGKTASFTPVLERGVPEKLFKVHAEACKPGDPKDRPSLRTAVRTVVARCPALQPRIDLQKKDWDVDENVPFKIRTSVGRVGKVLWTFDGGKTEEQSGDTHSHSYGKSGKYTVKATAYCADCGASFDAGSADVEIHCPALNPVIVLPGTNGVERASFGRRERIDMEIRVAEGGKVRSAAWDFGDGTPPAKTGERTGIHHEYENYAKAIKVRATVVCERCGREESADKSLTIEAQPPRASFSIAPDKATFTVKSRIKLQDTSLGDVDKCVWTLDGKVFAECGRGESVDLVLPSRPTECTIGMTASNALGASSEAQPRTIRVRFGWWAVLIFLIAGGVFIWLAWRLFGRNAPRDWQVYCWAGKAPELKKGQYPDEKDKEKGLATDLRESWSIWSKRSSIALGTLLYGDPEYETPDFPPETLAQKWRIEMLEGDPDVSVEGAQSYDNQSAKIRGGSSDEFGRCYFLFQNISPDAKEKSRYVRFFVDRSPKPSWRYPALFILTVLLVLAAVFRACLSFAI